MEGGGETQTEGKEELRSFEPFMCLELAREIKRKIFRFFFFLPLVS